MICIVAIETDDGVFTAGFTQNGLAELSFPDRRHALKTVADVPKQWREQTESTLTCVLGGQQPATLPPLDLSRGTAFQQRVWRALLQIPAGETRSYGEIAEAVDAPGAARAVGAACGANPIPVIVPCHRVLAAGKKLGGFSAGLKWKQLLLEREGVAKDIASRRDRTVEHPLLSKVSINYDPVTSLTADEWPTEIAESGNGGHRSVAGGG
jgi:methylated-DNA-[protein]-cysteine S-methyltransferase